MDKEALAKIEKDIAEMHSHDPLIPYAIRDAMGWKETEDFYGFRNPMVSVDSALGFMTKALPGAEYSITTLYGIAQVELPLNNSDGGSFSTRREDGNVQLAICQTVLKALIG